MSEGYKLYGGTGVEIEPLEVSEDGTYTAPLGKAFNPVKVSGGGSTGGGVLSVGLTMDEITGDLTLGATARTIIEAIQAGKVVVTALNMANLDDPSVGDQAFSISLATAWYHTDQEIPYWEIDGLFYGSNYELTRIPFTATSLDDQPTAMAGG